jgi:hypothetical protein
VRKKVQPLMVSGLHSVCVISKIAQGVAKRRGEVYIQPSRGQGASSSSMAIPILFSWRPCPDAMAMCRIWPGGIALKSSN